MSYYYPLPLFCTSYLSSSLDLPGIGDAKVASGNCILQAFRFDLHFSPLSGDSVDSFSGVHIALLQNATDPFVERTLWERD